MKPDEVELFEWFGILGDLTIGIEIPAEIMNTSVAKPQTRLNIFHFPNLIISEERPGSTLEMGLANHPVESRWSAG
jgi:hypothetical protein